MRVHHNTGQLGVLDQSLVERMTREKESWSKMIVAASVPNKLMNVSLVNRECIYTLHTSGQRVLRQERRGAVDNSPTTSSSPSLLVPVSSACWQQRTGLWHSDLRPHTRR